MTSVPRRRLRVVATVVAATAASTLSPVPASGPVAAQEPPASETGLWIVQLTSPSVAAAQAPTQVALIGNHITGPVSVDRNVTGTAPLVIAANTIICSLRCAGNQPPPVNNAEPNTVTGPKSGQCRDL